MLTCLASPSPIVVLWGKEELVQILLCWPPKRSRVGISGLGSAAQMTSRSRLGVTELHGW